MLSDREEENEKQKQITPKFTLHEQQWKKACQHHTFLLKLAASCINAKLQTLVALEDFPPIIILIELNLSTV